MRIRITEKLRQRQERKTRIPPNIPNNRRTFLLTLLPILCCAFCDLVVGKVSQINYGKHPFELRTAFPTPPPRTYYVVNTSLALSASNINPKGFDFSKLHSPRPSQPLAQSVTYDEKTVIPLAWVNLPLFDTPTFSVFKPPQPTSTLSPQYSSAETKTIQQDTFSSPTPQSWNGTPKAFDLSDLTTSNNTDSGTSESRSSPRKAQLVKSDWDGRNPNEIQMSNGNPAEGIRTPDFASLTSDSPLNVFSTERTTTFPPPSVPTISMPFERRIQLSNRGGESQKEESDPITQTPRLDSGAQNQDFGIDEEKNGGLHDGGEDPTASESRMTHEKSTGSLRSRLQNQSQGERETTLLSSTSNGIPEEARLSPQVATSTLSPLTFGVPNQIHNEPSDKYHHHTNSGSGSDYRYQYAVSNTETMDVHSHSESRTGTRTEGEYSVLEADGWTRIVSYTADDRGFRATVRRVKV